MGSLGMRPREKGGDGAYICRNGDGAGIKNVSPGYRVSCTRRSEHCGSLCRQRQMREGSEDIRESLSGASKWTILLFADKSSAPGRRTCPEAMSLR